MDSQKYRSRPEAQYSFAGSAPIPHRSRGKSISRFSLSLHRDIKKSLEHKNVHGLKALMDTHAKYHTYFLTGAEQWPHQSFVYGRTDRHPESECLSHIRSACLTKIRYFPAISWLRGSNCPSVRPTVRPSTRFC